jgi:hypothetical protein
VLFTTMPHALPVRASELPSLDDWIRRGNTLVLMAALDDTPRWSAAVDASFATRLAQLSQLRFALVPASQSPAAPQVTTRPAVELTPIGKHPLLAGVESIATASDLPGSRWRALPATHAPLLELARRRDTGDPAVWITSHGAGRLIVSAYASPFANRQLGQSDNARWLADLVGLVLAPDGVFIFDDAHQGLVSFYDPDRFFSDPRLHRTLLWMLLLWLVFVLGSQRLRGAAGRAEPIDDVAMLRVSAGFFANTIRPAAVARRLFEHFFNSLRRRLSLPENGSPVWEWIEAHARVPRSELDGLRRSYQRSQADHSVNLVDLQAQLSQLAGQLT